MREKEFLPLYKGNTPIDYSKYLLRRVSSSSRLLACIVGLFILFWLISSRSSHQTNHRPTDASEGFDSSWIDRANWRRDSDVAIAERRSIYQPTQFAAGHADYNPAYIPVTAVILNWKRPEGVKRIVQYLSKYPFITEILVWNNNKEMRLSVKDFGLDPTVNPILEVRVWNSDENLHDLSKYTTCSLATNDYCYFQDDDWMNMHLDALYTNFLRAPQLIHSNTMPVIHLEHQRWQFWDPEVHLHTGFTWLGCGSFVPRENVQRFMAQLGAVGLGKDRLRLADMYFSIWNNDFPWQFSNPLTPLEQKGAWSESEGVDQWAIVYYNINDAVSKLLRSLAATTLITKNDYFTRHLSEPIPEKRDARAPCSNDLCLFHTSQSPFPLPSTVVFNRTLTTTVKEQEAHFNALDFPSNEFWQQHHYFYAVDGDDSTCWNSRRPPQMDDFFGLHAIVAPNAPTFIIRGHNLPPSTHYLVTISKDGQTFDNCPFTDTEPFHLTLKCNVSGAHFIRIVFSQDLQEPIEVCSLRWGDLSV
ncbi:hypothetical protein BZG36_00458 [Bifiguratus adelaidae]|uniref:Uncharacterized protein n=1 Tax=Bifiguratus adelaidae TaxID=1938954 RepID=A0A261Y7E9_9FUNG|nr:hypothetical protein BZG36_00458 [Bifiguratus adelaidae]